MDRGARDLGVLLLALPFMTVGPAWFALTGEPAPYAPAWRMFEDVGLGFCDVDFTSRGRALDRYTPFGARGVIDAPAEVRDIADREQAIAVANAICDHDDVPSVHVAMRCAESSGWEVLPPVEVVCE